MRKLPYKEPAFTGTLPPNKPFAFPTNASRSGLPATATAYPLHNPVAHRKPLPPTTIIPQVVLSPHINMTGGYPTIPRPHHHSYSIPQQPTHQKTYSRPRAANASTHLAATPLQVSANGDVTFRKNFHTVVTSTGGTPAHWRRNDSQIPCANCGTLVSRKSWASKQCMLIVAIRPLIFTYTRFPFAVSFMCLCHRSLAIWRLGARNEKLCNACGQYNKKWNGQHRPVSLFPNTVTPTFRK